jgi:hypothetical protein
LDDSAGMVERVRQELKQWIFDKGSEGLKRLAGLI